MISNTILAEAKTAFEVMEWNGCRFVHISGSTHGLFRKEVIQPQVLLRLPCYDFTPIMNHTLGRCLQLFLRKAGQPADF